MREAVIVVDMIYDFVYGVLQPERGERIIPNIEELLESARKAEKPVIFSGDAHFATDPEIEVWGEHAMRGSKGAAPLEELPPEPSDYVLEKRTYSAFHETGLDPLLRSLDVDTVVICGLHTDTCDRHTAADAFFRGYRVVVPEDCVQAFTDEAHSSGLEYLEKVYGAKITSSEELAQEWGAIPATR
ncbi:MAG: isochorismatase family cysteine hydrolase [Rubrobacteraceae bacterium]